jgi:outer membrane protein
MGLMRKLVRGCVSAAAFLCASSHALRAETIEGALARAYQDNPQLNAQRAQLRATDENVPQALSGYRPKVGIIATVGEQHGDLTEYTTPNNPSQASAEGLPPYTNLSGNTTPYTYGITATQTLFNGFQTANRTQTAESQVLAGREGLRVIEQTVLLNAATIYMDVLRDYASVQIQRSNVRALGQLLGDTKKRFSVQDVTATDVAQAQAQLAAAESALLVAEYTLATSQAQYEAIIGIAPRDLSPATPVERFAPTTLAAAIDAGLRLNPNITAAMYGVDVAHLQVKIAQGALYPNLLLQVTAQQNSAPALGETSAFNASVVGQLTIPLYQGGAEYSLIRQSKETVAQQRLNLQLTRNQARAAVVQAWSQSIAAKGELQKALVEVTAAEAAVNGISKELRVGERTTFDLLQAQQILVNARTALITAQHDRVVASYNLLAAAGALSPTTLHLPTKVYSPEIHYQQVRDVWAGMRIPDGK